MNSADLGEKHQNILGNSNIAVPLRDAVDCGFWYFDNILNVDLPMDSVQQRVYSLA